MRDEHKTTVWGFFLSAPRSFGSFLVTVADHSVSLTSAASTVSPGVFPAQLHLLVTCKGLELSSVPFRWMFVEIYFLLCAFLRASIPQWMDSSWTVESNKSQFLRAGDEFRTHHPGK